MNKPKQQIMDETGPLLQTTVLKRITGYERSGDVERCLKEQGITIFYGKNGPWTTLDLINAAGGLVQGRLLETEHQPLL